jgi:hypothetical protein
MPANAVLAACLAAVVVHQRQEGRPRQSARGNDVTVG